jgi:hypothetical protein
MEEKMDKYVELTSKGKNEYLKVLENTGWFDFSGNTKDEIYMPDNIFQKAIENGILPEEDYFRK